MHKLLSLFLTFGGILCAADIQTYYDQSAWLSAAIPLPAADQSETLVTEFFTGGQVSTPGFTIQTCHSYPQSTCAPYDSGGGYWGGFVNGYFEDTIGAGSAAYRQTRFLLPTETQAVSFDINVPQVGYPAIGTFYLTLFDQGVVTQLLTPFGGVTPPNQAPSNAYSGFVGFTSDQSFDAVEFDVFPALATYDLDNFAFVETAPEPGTLAIVGLGLTGLFLVGRRRTRSRVRTLGPTGQRKTYADVDDHDEPEGRQQ
jgi:hypothetical protein